MSSFELSCQVCYNKYDDQLRIPRIIPTCGHTLCNVCIMQILDISEVSRVLICPFDKVRFPVRNNDVENLPRNISLVQLIEAQRPDPKEVCQFHQKINDKVCIECKTIICENCVEESTHKTHKVLSRADAEKASNEKKRHIEELIDTTMKEQLLISEEVQAAVRMRSGLLLANIEKRFVECLNVITTRKKELENEVRHSLIKQQMEICEKYERFLSKDEQTRAIIQWRDQAQKKLAHWKKTENSELCFNVLTEQLTFIEERIDKWKVHLMEEFTLESFSEKLEGIDICFNQDGFNEIVREFCQVTYNEISHKKTKNNEFVPALRPEDINIQSQNGYLYQEEQSPEPIWIQKDIINFEGDPIKRGGYLYKQREESKNLLNKILSDNKINSKWINDALGEGVVLSGNSTKKQFFSTNWLSNGKKKLLRYLKTVRVIYGDLSEISMKRACNSLSQLCNLNYLKIEFNEDFLKNQTNQKGTLEQLSLFLVRLVYLERVDLDLRNCPIANTTEMTVLGNALSALQNVSQLTLRFPRWEMNIDEGIQNFSRCLTLLQELKILSLELPSKQKLLNAGVFSLFSSISRLKKLETLRLGFRDVEEFNESHFVLLEQSLHMIANLKNLRLELPVRDNTTMTRLSEIISKLTRLNILEINLYNVEAVSSEKTILLFQSLTRLEALTKLHVGINKWYSGFSYSLPKLAQSISKMKNLSSFSLSLSKCCPLSNNTLAEFSINLKKAVNLTEILFKTDQMTTAGFSHFCSAIIGLAQLKGLKLDLSSLEGVADSYLEELSNSVSNLASLNCLEIYLKGCQNLTDNGISQLAKAVGQKSALKTISLNLKDYSTLTDEALFSMSDMITKLKNLEGLRLDLSNCPELTEKGIKKLVASICEKPEADDKLTWTQLSFIRCSKINEAGMSALKELAGLLEKKEIQVTINV